MYFFNSRLSLSPSGSGTNQAVNIPRSSFLEPGLVAAEKLNNYVHILYTLSLFLSSKERKNIQAKLTHLKMAPIMFDLFNYLSWTCQCESLSMGDNQMKRHICPEISIKIQFLKLFHNFCDHSE
jgi:hypothetical protein